jgi:hypothetical protein
MPYYGFERVSGRTKFEVVTRALEAMNHVIFIIFHSVNSDDDFARVVELIRKLRSVTSIRVPDSHRLPAIQRDTPLFINDSTGSNKIETFLHDSQSQLGRTRRTHIFIDIGFYHHISPARLHLSPDSKIAVSFFGPPSGSLVLRLTHWHSSPSHDAAVTLLLKESHDQGSHTFEYPVLSSLSVTSITLSPSPSNNPSFVPNTRNNLIIEFTQGSILDYVVKDIQLQDEAGNDYNGASPEA